MKYKISKRYFNRRIMLFALYNIVYVLYMIGKLPRSANLVSLSLFTIVCLFDVIPKRKYRFLNEIKLIMIPIIVMIGISLIKQVYYNDFSLSRMTNILYLVLPAVDAFAIVNTVKDREELKEFVYIMFIRMGVLFLLQNWGNFSLNALRTITFRDSSSSVFESSMAHELFFMVIIFKYLNKNKLAIISGILCMLCFKRLSFLLTLLVLIFYDRIPQNKDVKKWIIVFAKGFFIVSPLIIIFLVSKTGSTWFLNTFGVDLNVFSTGRMFYINLVHSRMDHIAGYGATHEFLAKVIGDQYVTSIHCDVVRITWECTIISLILYINNMIELVKKNYVLFFMMMYCLFECVISHFMEGMTAWLLIYIFVYIVKTDKEPSNVGMRARNVKYSRKSTKAIKKSYA